MNLGFWEVIIILGTIFFLFGRRKLPELGRALKKTKVEFKKALNEDEIDVTEASKRASDAKFQSKKFTSNTSNTSNNKN